MKTWEITVFGLADRILGELAFADDEGIYEDLMDACFRATNKIEKRRLQEWTYQSPNNSGKKRKLKNVT